MAKRVFICVGHGGSDSGAVGYVVEKDAVLTIALEAKRVLEKNGVVVGISRTRDEEDGLTKEVNMANAFDADAVMAIHANAGGGDGFEAFVQTNGFEDKSRSLAQCIESRVISIGQNSRGIKTKLGSNGDYYYWLRNVHAPTVLLEGFFVDTSDAFDFDTKEKQEALGRVYAYGILDHLGIPVSQNRDKDYTDTIRGVFRVAANGGLNLRAGASAENSIIETMQDGSYVTCYGYHIGGWHYVESQAGNTGYCHKDYLEKVMPFVDVSPNAYYFDAVKWALDKGITSGTAKDKFSPDTKCTRAQAVTMIWTKCGKLEPESYEPFSDVAPTDYFAKAVQWAHSKGITAGIGDNKFDPNNACTRGQIVTMLYAAAGRPDVDGELPFDDVKESDYFSKAVKWAKAKGITAGVGSGKFAPHEPCTRAQMVCFLYKV